jgi:hypothetical protein
MAGFNEIFMIVTRALAEIPRAFERKLFQKQLPLLLLSSLNIDSQKIFHQMILPLFITRRILNRPAIYGGG